MQLNYGCAPSAMLHNIEGFAFWYAALVQALIAIVFFKAGKELKELLNQQ